MKKISISANRRRFLRGALTAAPAAALAVSTGSLTASAQSPSAQSNASAAYQPSFFNQDEYALLSALADTLIPADDTGPGALEAGVPEFIDAQMNTPYGRGQLWYMQGPFTPEAAPEFGYQLPYPPRELYKKGLAEFDAAIRQQYGRGFVGLNAQQREKMMGEFEQGHLGMATIPTAALFNLLLQNVHEGYFCDPTDGGNKGMGSWKMIGFPGARADYYDWVDQYGRTYPLPPISRG
ncbi:gluconate 2-dehydrogenase gamma chain [Herbaspirillum rubrisubalbicans]|uniref:Gluconate 2-dehydrogenase n=1 Tax=Herbaspirillum rubrisubalbicans Os34 TaxID=1235827 RepID=A0A6M3ZY43_9BURK|nr:gluconate 2-dehydrogenase subunit 3 family protein [Herbaspirillum rubrisubalbicans]MCP1574967.1 gluconate 2-dehydrogenase gamma chain [Herbaspirillum rubrisubalbicans]QJQ03487.1 gluconate 2-dehydrogenase [Herbaspirillum rubrisubalbicans Os34]